MEIDTEHTESSENNVEPVDQIENRESNSDSNDDSQDKITKKQRKYIIESDSEDGESGIEQKDDNSDFQNLPKTKKYIIDSDSENEEPVTIHNKSFATEDNPIYNINSKGELIPENNSISNNANPLKSILSSLCDPETSSDEEEDQNKSDTEVEKSPPHSPIKHNKSAKNTEEQPRKMSVQEAAKQRVEIQSESQRMTRESNISLPYHKPKSYTIKEFLAKRSKLATPKIQKAPVSLKMTKDQLIEISKTVDERIKQVEEFYKSDDSEEETEDTPREVVTNFLADLFENVMKTVEEKTSSEEIPENIPEPMEIDYNLQDSSNDESSMHQEPEIIPKKTPQELLREQLLTIQPKLSGGPDQVIDLDKGVTRPNEVKKLVDKFFQHSVKRAPLTQETNLKIMEVTAGGRIIEEKITTTKIEDEDDKRAINEIPGAKLTKLRFELQHQIAQRRAELWKQKQEQGECVITTMNPEEKFKGDEIDSEFGETYDEDFLDNEDEEEFTESEIDEEDDYEIKETKSKPKSAFIDEEAEESDADDENEPENEAEEEIPEKKPLKRIIHPAEDDSDSDQEPEPSTSSAIPPNVHKTPQKPATKSNFDFLTPVSYLTGLQNTNSAAKCLKDSPNVSPFALPAEPSPFKEANWQKSLQKKLFTDSSGELLSQTQQPTTKDLAEICSGTFPDTQIEQVPSTQDLAEICTGAFPSASAAASQIVEITQTEIKNLNHNDDQLISQLLDEEELERFKKKFIDSPTTTIAEKNQSAGEVNATGLINSDDENDELEVTTKRNQKKLVFSDDDEEDQEQTEESEQDSDSETENIEYDSEENEVTPPAIDAQKQKFHVGEFLENEAELSESEWGSEDEDERGMDTFEVEEGDKEKYDENQVRQDIERIHMRQVLDDDQRDVKLLQELLLEDGELHGSGRQRQFRWKNIDSLTDDNQTTSITEEEAYFDEDDNEQNFRIMRLKRETFLQEQQKKAKQEDDIDSVLGKSSILKFGQAAVRKIQTITNSTQKESEGETVIAVKQSFSLASKSRGSFLGKSEEVLERLAKISNTYNGPGAKNNSHGFVFKPLARINAEETETSNKRKAKQLGAGGTPNAIKKIRLDNCSPATSKPPTKKNVYTKLF